MIAALLQAWKELKRGRKKAKKTGTRREKEREASATNPSERFRERIERRSEQIYIIHLNPLTGWLRPREQEQACSGLKASFLLFCFLPFLPLSLPQPSAQIRNVPMNLGYFTTLIIPKQSSLPSSWRRTSRGNDG